MKSLLLATLSCVSLACCVGGGGLRFEKTFECKYNESQSDTFSKPSMVAPEGFFVVKNSNPDHPEGFNLKCMNLNDGSIVWETKADIDSERYFSYYGVEDGVLVKINGEFVCLDLKTGKEKWKLSKDSEHVFYTMNFFLVLSYETNRRNDDTYRYLMSIDHKTRKVKWQIEIESDSSRFRMQVGKTEIAHWKDSETPFSLKFIDLATGRFIKEINNVSKVFNNYDNKTNILYISDDTLWLQSHEGERAIMAIDIGDINDVAFSIMNGRLFQSFSGKNQIECLDLEGKSLWKYDPNRRMTASTYNRFFFADSQPGKTRKILMVDSSTHELVTEIPYDLEHGPWADFLGAFFAIPTSKRTIEIRSIQDGMLANKIELEKDVRTVWHVPGFGLMVACSDLTLVFYKMLE